MRHGRRNASGGQCGSDALCNRAAPVRRSPPIRAKPPPLTASTAGTHAVWVPRAFIARDDVFPLSARADKETRQRKRRVLARYLQPTRHSCSRRPSHQSPPAPTLQLHPSLCDPICAYPSRRPAPSQLGRKADTHTNGAQGASMQALPADVPAAKRARAARHRLARRH